MDGFAVTFCLMGSPVSATRMEHYGLTGGFVEVCKIVYCLKAAIQEHSVVVGPDRDSFPVTVSSTHLGAIAQARPRIFQATISP